MRVDDAYRLDLDRGFAWWPNDFCQNLWADPVNADGIYRIHCEMEILKGTGHAIESEVSLTQWMCQTTLNALVYDQTKDVFKLHSAIDVTVENADRMKRILLAAAGFQIADTIQQIPALARSLRLLLAKSTHPSTGLRQQPHNLVKVEDQFFKPFGAESCRWISSAEWLAIQDTLGPGSTALETDGTTYASAQYDWPGYGTIHVDLRADNPHPVYGNGLSSSISLPFSIPMSQRAHLALELNLAERAEPNQCHDLGSWCCQGTDLGFQSFIPNISFTPHLLEEMAKDMHERSFWVQDIFRNRLSSFCPAPNTEA